MKSKLIIFCLFFLSGAAGLALSFYLHREPVQSDVQTIQVAHYPATFIKQLKGDPRAGEKIFKEFCSTCHANPPIIDITAPRLGDKKSWKIRRQMGIDALLKLTISGVGAMPARGGCFECSDEQLRETIKYMLRY